MTLTATDLEIAAALALAEAARCNTLYLTADHHHLYGDACDTLTALAARLAAAATTAEYL